MAEKKLLRVREAFAYMVGSYPDVFRPGDVVPSDHPAVKGREDKFEAVGPDNVRVRDANAALVPAEGVIESATAAPGEKRSEGRPAKKTAKK